MVLTRIGAFGERLIEIHSEIMPHIHLNLFVLGDQTLEQIKKTHKLQRRTNFTPPKKSIPLIGATLMDVCMYFIQHAFHFFFLLFLQLFYCSVDFQFIVISCYCNYLLLSCVAFLLWMLLFLLFVVAVWCELKQTIN